MLSITQNCERQLGGFHCGDYCQFPLSVGPVIVVDVLEQINNIDTLSLRDVHGGEGLLNDFQEEVGGLLSTRTVEVIFGTRAKYGHFL